MAATSTGGLRDEERAPPARGDDNRLTMPRRFLDRILPSHGRLQRRWFLRPFAAVLNDPALWSTHRRNVLRSLAAGLFIAFIPFPIHTALAGVTAAYMRTNVAVAIAASWVANPLTMGPMYYGAYRVGLWLLRQPPSEASLEFSVDGLADGLELVWPPLLLGCLVCGIAVAAVSYVLLNWLWVSRVRRRFHRRNMCSSRA